jgi:hypothetical protein
MLLVACAPSGQATPPSGVSSTFGAPTLAPAATTPPQATATAAATSAVTPAISGTAVETATATAAATSAAVLPATGNVPWSMGFESGASTGWTGSDFIQDILLVQQGPDYVNKTLSGDVPYNDAAVQEA